MIEVKFGVPVFLSSKALGTLHVHIIRGLYLTASLLRVSDVIIDHVD